MSKKKMTGFTKLSHSPWRPMKMPAWVIDRSKPPPKIKITDKVFATAVGEAVRRYDDAARAWSSKKVRFDPKFKKSDLKEHRELWSRMQAAQYDIGIVAIGLLGLLSAPDLNESVRRSLPGLLEAAAKRRP